MAALTAASWTLTVTERRILNRRKVVDGTLALAGTDTYPDNGIPLPAIGQFGFVRSMERILFTGVDPTSGTVANYVTAYDKTNHKMFFYEEEAAAAGGPLLEADTAEVPGGRTYNFIAEGW